MVLVLCLTLLPTAAFAEGEDMSLSSGETGGSSTGEGGSVLGAPGSSTGGEGGGVLGTPGSSTGGEGGGVFVTPGSSTGEGGGVFVPPSSSTGEGGGVFVTPGSSTGEGGGVLGTPSSSTGEGGGVLVTPGGEGGGVLVTPGGEGGGVNNSEDTRTEIWCKLKPSLIQRGYDGTADGSTIPIDLTFTDGTNEIKLTEGTGFTATKTFDSADAGWHIVTVEITLIGEAAGTYKLKAGEETFTIKGHIDKAHPNLTVSLSKTACTVGEKLLPLLSVSGVQEDAAVTYYYTLLDSGYLEFEGSEAVPAIDGNTAISEPGTYYVYAKTGETTNYKEERSATVALTVNEAVVEAASVTRADGTDGGTYESLPAALNAAQNGDTVKLLANHVTDADALNALGGDFTFAQYASIVPVVTKTLTLDLNHKTVDYLEVGFSETNEATQKKETFATGNLTVTGEAAYGRISNLMFMAGALDIRSGEIGGSGCAGLFCDANSGSVTVSNGTVYGLTVMEGASVTVNGGSNHAGEWVVASGATLKITGGTFGEVQFTHNGTIAISGGTFKSIKSYIAEKLQPLMSLLDTQKVHAFYKGDDVQDGNAKELADVTVKEHTHTMGNNKCACGFSCTHTNTDGTSTIDKDGKCTICGTQFAAGIGETYYTDVKSALDAAADGQTVKLLANKMLPDGIYVSKTLTLDLNGHSLSGYSLNVGGLTATSQVRTGNLTVIDSSGGNGAVGVAVRDGGTLVFHPENDNTTLLQLEVWGGTVGLYGGKILRSGLRLNNSITLGNLLPGQAGLAYYNGDTQLTLEEAAAQTCDLVVKLCSHGGKNGFDKNAAACPNCNAPAVAETALNNGEGSSLWRRFANLQTAIDADRDGGAEFKLLADVTGDYTINGTQNTALDLNGHRINGTVTVKGIKGDLITTTLSNTQNTTIASIDKVIAFAGAELGGSKYPAVIGELTLAEGATWNSILNGTALGYKVLNADGTHKWYAPDEVNGSQLKNVIINRLPIPAKTLYLKVGGKNLTGGNSPKVERGTIVQLCAYCNAKDADVSIYIGESNGNNNPTYSFSKQKAKYRQIGTTWYYVVDLDASTIGTYDIYFTATKDGYSVTSGDKKLTVTKPNLRNAQITFRSSNESTYEPYNATTTAPGFTVTYNGKTLQLGVDYTASGTASSAGVSTQTLTIKAVEGSEYTGSKTAKWRIVPHKAKVEVGDVIKAYDGTTDLPDGKISLVSAAGSASYQAGLPLPLSEGNGFELTDAKYDSANASETEKNISFTVKLTDTNYTFEDGTKEKAFTLKGSETDKTFKINQATIDPSQNRFEQTVFNDLAKTYEINLKQFLDKILPEGGTYGDIQYGQPSVSMYSDYYPVGGATIGNGKLSLPINKAASIQQGDEIGTVAVEVETTNYQPFTLTIHVIAQDKFAPVMDGTISASEITYGQALADSKLTVNGTMQDLNTRDAVDGTFAWKNGTFKPDAGSYEAEWVFTPAEGYEEYATATGTVTVKVKPAKLTVSVTASRAYYTGEAQIASIIASGQSVDSTPVTFTYSDKVDGNYTSGGPTFTDAGTYTAYYKAEAANHEPATGTFTVTIDPLPISLLSVSSISKTYNGSADVTLTADKLTFFSKVASRQNITLPDTALAFSDAQFTSKQADGRYLPSPEVGGGKALSFTMTLTSDNYVFEKTNYPKTDSSVFATDDVNRFTITKAAAPTMQPIELTVINGLAKTYLVNLPALPTLGDNCKYGSIKYEACNFDLIGEGGYANSTAMITSNDEFQLTVPAVESQTEGSVGTVGVKITTDNYQDMLLTVEVIAKNKIVPVLDGEITATPITFGQILRVSTITGTMKDDGKTVEGTFEWTDPSIKPDKAGDYQAEWTFTPAAGYEEYATATGTVTIKVNKAAPTFTAPTAQKNLTYTGQEQALITAGMTDHGTMQYSLTENGTYSQDSPVGTDAGAYTVWYRVIGDANHNDTAPASVAVRIGKKPLTITWVTAASKPYDGTTNADITGVTFDGVNLNRGTDYTVTANFDDASVGNGKNITATVALMEQAAKNYALEQNGFFTTGSIIKAAAPDFTKETALTIVNGYEKTYTVTLPALPTLETPKAYGALTYEIGEIKLNDGYYTSGAKVENGELTLPIQKNDVETTGSVGTVTVVIKSANYEDITLTVNVSAKNRPTPVLSGALTLTPAKITYGDPLSKIKITGTMKVGDRVVEGTFSWQQPGDTVLDASDLGHDMGWRFTPEDENAYSEATGSAMVKVDKATQYGKLSMTGYAYGGTPSTPTLTDRTGDPNAQVRYTYSTTDSGLVQTWDIQNPPALNAGTYRMFARIGQTSNYYEYDVGYCEFVVAKATPTYTKPTGLTAKYGQTLADVTLPDGWSWMDSSESVGDASNTPKTFRAKFTPTDTENYNTVEDIALKVAVNKADQAALTIQGADSVVYGQTLTLTATGGTGTGAVTYRMDTANSTGKATIDPNTGVLTPVKVGSVSVIATKAGNKDYNDVTSAAFVLMIKPATPTGEPKYTQITASDKTLKDAALTIEGSTLQPHDGKLEWVDEEGNVLPDSTWVEVNTAYQWRFTPTDTNYTTLTGKIMLYRYYTIEATAGIGGTISPSGNVGICGGEDQTFTITPNKGYAISNVRIDGKSIGAVKSYTFENVSRDHTIHVIFMKANGNPQTGVFVEEATGRYYEDTVD